MKAEEKTITEVKDIPAEIWIKVLSGIGVIMLAVVAYFGDRFIVGQDVMNANLNANTKEIIKIISLYRSLEDKVSRNTKVIGEVNVKTDNNTQEIYKLGGFK